MTLTPFEMAAALLAFTAAAAWLNARLLRLPTAAGLMLVGLTVAAVATVAGQREGLSGVLALVDYPHLVLNILLGYLLFAGAMNVDLAALARRGWITLAMATLGTAITALLSAGGLWLLAKALGFDLDFRWALVFGTLISPTDPIAVLAMTKRTALQPEVRAQLEGEALFNDGLAVVLFSLALAYATGQGAGLHLAGHAGLEAFGGAAIGLIIGLIAVVVIHGVEDWAVETLITLVAATLTYALCQHLHLSGPLGVVAAGLVMGSRWAERGMSPASLRYIHPVWHMTDEGLNAVLFLLVGLEAVEIAITPGLLVLALAAPALILAARWLSLAPALAFRAPARLVNLLTWAGVRGGLSIAMALSLPDGPARQPILAATFGVVVVSILLQSLTTERLALKTGYGEPLPKDG